MTRKLSLFTTFDTTKFLKGKQLMALNQDVLLDGDGNHIGFTVTVVVYSDSTDYGDDLISNAGDSYKVKIENKELKNLTLPCFVELIDPSGKVWGEFRNNLSLTAKNLKVLSNNHVS